MQPGAADPELRTAQELLEIPSSPALKIVGDGETGLVFFSLYHLLDLLAPSLGQGFVTWLELASETFTVALTCDQRCRGQPTLKMPRSVQAKNRREDSPQTDG